MTTESTTTGILDISIQQSTDDLTAGETFNFYVLIRNPLQVPCWIDSVRLGIPSGFELPRVTNLSSKDRKSEMRAKIEDIEHLSAKIAQHQTELDAITHQLAAQGDIQDADLQAKSKRLQSLLHDLRSLTRVRDRGIEISSGGTVHVLQFTGAAATPVSISSGGTVHELKIRHIDETAEDVDLERPIPKHIPLQPANVASFTISVKAKPSLFFTPAQYRLQFNVAYHFGNEAALHVTSVSHTVNVRAPTKTVLAGSAIGSVAGIGARYFANPGQFLSQNVLLPKLALAVVLGVVAVVFMSRKSEKQSFISVEDFWGGLVIGFLVAYSGTEALPDVLGMAHNPPGGITN